MVSAGFALLALACSGLALGAQIRDPACAPPAQPVDRNSHDNYFLGVPLGNGNTEVLHLSNAEKKEQSVKIETYSASGCVLQSVGKTVPASGTADVRVELAHLRPGYG